MKVQEHKEIRCADDATRRCNSQGRGRTVLGYLPRRSRSIPNPRVLTIRNHLKLRAFRVDRFPKNPSPLHPSHLKHLCQKHQHTDWIECSSLSFAFPSPSQRSCIRRGRSQGKPILISKGRPRWHAKCCAALVCWSKSTPPQGNLVSFRSAADEKDTDGVMVEQFKILFSDEEDWTH